MGEGEREREVIVIERFSCNLNFIYKKGDLATC